MQRDCLSGFSRTLLLLLTKRACNIQPGGLPKLLLISICLSISLPALFALALSPSALDYPSFLSCNWRPADFARDFVAAERSANLIVAATAAVSAPQVAGR